MLTKICGITTLNDAEIVASYFPDYMGFVFHKPSPRNISQERLEEISDSLRVCFGEGCSQLVGVLVNSSENFLEQIAPFVDVFQFHGEETPEFCREISQKFPNHAIWKALRIAEISDIEKISDYKACNGILLDSFSQKAQGGTGEIIAPEIFPKIAEKIQEMKKESPEQMFFMAGGLSAQNYKKILEKTGADGADLSSSLESKKGSKSEKKVEAFFVA